MFISNESLFFNIKPISPRPWAWKPPSTGFPPTTSIVIPSLNNSKRLILKTDFLTGSAFLHATGCSSSTRSVISPWIFRAANLFFQLIARRYEKTSTIFTSNKTFSQWNDIFADITIASAILDRVLHHCTVIHIKGESYRLKERKEYMKQKVQITNTLFENASS